jgi:hypothetical protein
MHALGRRGLFPRCLACTPATASIITATQSCGLLAYMGCGGGGCRGAPQLAMIVHGWEGDAAAAGDEAAAAAHASAVHELRLEGGVDDEEEKEGEPWAEGSSGGGQGQPADARGGGGDEEEQEEEDDDMELSFEEFVEAGECGAGSMREMGFVLGGAG